MSIPTVKVLHPDTPEGYMIINEEDLCDEHVLHDAKAEKKRRSAEKAAQDEGALSAIKDRTATGEAL